MLERRSFEAAPLDACQGKTWYIVHTRNRAERQAQLELARAGYETLWLHYRALVKHARRSYAVLRPLFPRYVFIAAEPWQGLYAANNAPGVSTVLYGSDGPFEVPASVIADLRKRGDEAGRVDTPKRHADDGRERLDSGASVNIVEGPLKGMPAVVDRDNGHEVQVLIEMLGRPMPATVSPGALKAV